MDIRNRTALELHFIDHNDTILFPVLADFYLQEGDINRTKQVCAIGLEHHPHNPDGQFILGQALRAEGNLHKAEKLFKTAISNGNIHVQAALALVEVQAALQRAAETLLKTWSKIVSWDPDNKAAIAALKKARKKNKRSPSRTVESPKSATHNKQNNTLDINPRLSTFTMVAVLRNQGLFNQALVVLDKLAAGGADPARVNREKTMILDTKQG